MRGAPPPAASTPPHSSVAQAHDELFAELAATRRSRAWQRHQALRRNRLRRALRSLCR